MRKPEQLIRVGQNGEEMSNDIGDTAVFFDFENIVLGVKDKFDTTRVLEHLNGRGDVHIRRAYADWGAYKRYQSDLLELGVEMVFLPTYGVRDKNRTDTAVCVDAMEILFTRPNVETYVIVSGDSDFGVLARRLRSYGKRVLGISAKSAASRILASTCHEFIFYESLTGQALTGYTQKDGEGLIRRALESISDSSGTFQPSLLKDRMRKMDSTFSERNFGFDTFVEFVEAYPEIIEMTRYDGGRLELRVKDTERTRRRRRRSRGRGGRGETGTQTQMNGSDEGGFIEQDQTAEATPVPTPDRPPRDRDRDRTPRDRSDRPDRDATGPGRAANTDGSRRRRGRGGRPSDAPETAASAAPAVAEASAATEQAPAPAKRTVRRPTDPNRARAAAVKACRALLKAKLGDEAVTPQTLQRRMVDAVPTFDPKKLGYPGMTAFLRDQPDLVTVTREGNKVRVGAAAQE